MPAIEKLAARGDKRAVRPLLDLLVEDRGFGDNDSFADRKAVPPVLDAIDPEWRSSEAGRDALRTLVAQLESPNPSTRASAVDSLAALRVELAVPCLVAQLEDSDFYVRQHTMDALASLGDRRALPKMILANVRAAGLYNQRVRQLWPAWAAEDRTGAPPGSLLASDEQPALVNELLSVLDSWPDWEAQALEESRRFRAANPQVLGSLDEDASKLWKIRAAACDALGEIGDPRAVGSLARALEDEEIPVRAAAAHALGILGNPRAKGPLRDALRRDHHDSRSAPGRSYDPDYAVHVTRRIAGALGRLRDAEAVEPLLDLVGGYSSLTAGSARSAIEALGDISDPRAVPALAKGVNEDFDPHTASLAVTALGKIGGAAACQALRESLERSKDDPRLRRLENELEQALARGGATPS